MIGDISSLADGDGLSFRPRGGRRLWFRRYGRRVHPFSSLLPSLASPPGSIDKVGDVGGGVSGKGMP